jgi:RNA polymerase sigma factor (sigma-70 family)
VTSLATDAACIGENEFVTTNTLPPRIEFGGKLTDESLWATAIDWVERNRKDVFRAGALAIKVRLMDCDDLLQTARVIAFTQCRRVAREGQIENFVPLFFSHLRKACLSEWQRHHHEVLGDFNWEALASVDEAEPQERNNAFSSQLVRERALMKALEQMTSRQREVFETLLGLQEGEGGLSQYEAAERLHIDRSTVSKTVDAACLRIKKLRAKPPSTFAKGRESAEPSHAQLVRQLKSCQAENQRLRTALITHLCAKSERGLR